MPVEHPEAMHVISDIQEDGNTVLVVLAVLAGVGVG
jgi:hypothetical protein